MNKQIIHTVFEQQAALFPDRPAIEDYSGCISYEALNRRANQLAHYFLCLGCENESVIGVLLGPGPALVQSMLAVFKSGNVYLPLDLKFSRKRFREIFLNTPCKIILTNKMNVPFLRSLLEELEINDQHIIILEEALISLAETQNPDVAITPDAGLYIVYTSGSTGEGKAILGSQKGLSNFIHWELKEFEIDAQCRVSQLSQITFDSSFRDILVPLCAGGTLCIPAAEVKTNVMQLIEWIEVNAITLIHCVPSLFRLITKELKQMQSKDDRFSSLRYVIMAGESLYSKDIRDWYDVAGTHAEIVNLYGTSETTLAKTFHRIKEIPPDPAQAIHVGKPIDNTFVAIVNDGKLCRIGEIGEIYIKTPDMTKGYYNDPLLTAAVFVQNPLVHDTLDIVHKTGDYGRYLKDRSIEYLGRLDDQVKINGMRVELNEVKLAIMNIPRIGEVEITTQKNSNNEIELVCYYTGVGMDEQEMRAFLKNSLAEYMIPSWMIPLKEFPLNINGKIDKKKLPKPDALAISCTEYVSPASETEKNLERIWCEVLGLAKISRHISFFRIGGNSLRAMQVISRIFHEYNVSIKINEVFNNPTIAELALIITGLAGQNPEMIEAVAQTEYYEVSHAQKRLWLLAQMEEDSLAYNISTSYLLSGPLHTDAFEKVFGTIIRRHESLRTTFHFVDGDVKQRVLAATEIYKLEVTDLTGLQDKYDVARQYRDREAASVFNLATGPLFRVRLLRMEKEKHLLILNMHHIICDDWSLKVLTKEVFTLYQSCRNGLPDPLPALPLQYKDFAAWHNQLLRNNLLQQDKQYWLDRFSGKIPVLKLPADFKRPAVKTYAGRTMMFLLDKETVKKLQEFCWQQDVTMFMLLLAALNALLYKYTGDEDIVIGSPIAGRLRKSLEDQIGFYLNLLPLRTRFNGDDDFINLLQTVKQTTLNAFEHQVYPFDCLVEDLAITGQRSHSPLFDVMLVLQNTPKGQGYGSFMGDISVTEEEQEITSSKYDLEFDCYEEEEGILIVIQYNSDLFTAGRISLLQKRFELLLQAIPEVAGCSLREIADRAEYEMKGPDAGDLSWNVIL